MSESGGIIPEELKERLARLARFTSESDHRVSEAERELSGANDERLMAVLLDRSRSHEARATALGYLIRRLNTSKELGPLLRSLWDDPDELLACDAIRYLPPFDLAGREALFGLLNDPRAKHRNAAATTLARQKVMSLLPILKGWLESTDYDRFHTAVGCLPWLLMKDDLRNTLADAWNTFEEGRTDAREKRVYLASELLRLGDDVGLDFLDDIALNTSDVRSPWAARALYAYAADVGLDRMSHLLDRGSPEVRLLMAHEIRTIAKRWEPLSVDSLVEARRWVETRKLEIDLSPDQAD